MKARILFAAVAYLAPAVYAGSAGISVDCVTESPQCAYASTRLLFSLATAEVMQSGRKLPADIELRIDPAVGAEGFSITPDGPRVVVAGGDARGLIYGALALRDELLAHGSRGLKATTQHPATAFRGIKFNTPWDTYRPSSALDQHYATVRDPKFW